MKHICDCGAPATYHFKNGTWCCSKSRCSCPAYKKKHSAIMSGIHQKFKEKYGDGWFKGGRTVKISQRTSYPFRGDHVCVYCGGYADFQLKDGRWCCHEKRGSCPEIRRKNSEGCKKAYVAGRKKSPTLGHVAWNKGLTKETDARVAKGVATNLAAYAKGRKGTWFGRHHTEEQKRRLREVRLEQRAKHGMKIYSPNVSETACAYIDQLNESKGWHLQHGLNGGEVRVDNYFLDGYDKELNIAFEYDEPAHYTEQGELRERCFQNELHPSETWMSVLSLQRSAQTAL